MKKTILSLSLCLVTLGLSDLSIPKASADILEGSCGADGVGQSSPIKKTIETEPSGKSVTSADMETTSRSEKSTTDSASETPLTNLFLKNAQNFETPILSSDSLAENRFGSETVNSERQLRAALVDGVSTIIIGQDFTVSSQVSYRSSFTIIGGGNTLTFRNSGQFYNGSAINHCEVDFQNLNIVSNVSSNGGGELTPVVGGGDGGTVLTLNNVVYSTSTGCPLVATANGSGTSYFDLVFTGKNTLNFSGGGGSNTTLFQNVGNMTVSNDASSDQSTTINATGNSSGSVVGLWTGENSTHEILISPGATFEVNSSKNMLFNMTGNFKMTVGENAVFSYESQGNTNGNNGIIGGALDVNSNNQVTNSIEIDVAKNSKTLFQTDGPAATFETPGAFGDGTVQANVVIKATSPEYVEFKSTSDTAAVKKGSHINITRNDNTSDQYYLIETPVSGSEIKRPVSGGAQVAINKDQKFKDIIYTRAQQPTVTLSASALVEANTSTINCVLGGSYDNYSTGEILATTSELSEENQIDNAINSAISDSTGKSGYYQEGVSVSAGEPNFTDFTNVWAGTYYLYARLSNASSGQKTDWVKTTVTVNPYLAVGGNDSIDFVGGYNLTLLKSATLVSAGNTDMALTFNNLVANDNSSENVTLVDMTNTNQKQLRLSLQGENANSVTMWSPLLLGASSFNDKVILSPYWAESNRSQATFKVSGNYSGPLGANQIEKVSYQVTMGLSENN